MSRRRLLLTDLAALYLAHRPGLSAVHRDDIAAICRRCQAWGGERLPGPWIAEWLASEAATVSLATVARHRRIVAAVLRWAGDQGWARPVRLPPIRCLPGPPVAWTLDELERLLSAAAHWPGQMGPHRAGEWWLALLLTCYWTAARIGSLLAARPEDCDLDHGTLLLRRTKNGRWQVHRLHPQAVEAIRRIYQPSAERLFPWPWRRRRLYEQMRAICIAAGLSPQHGLFHRLRRTCLSLCWAVDPAIAQRQADHAHPAVTLRHYIDPRLAAPIRCAADVLPVPQVKALAKH